MQFSLMAAGAVECRRVPADCPRDDAPPTRPTGDGNVYQHRTATQVTESCSVGVEIWDCIVRDIAVAVVCFIVAHRCVFIRSELFG